VTHFVPDHERISADIRRQIRDGRLVPGELLPTRHKLAGRYDVSPGTIDRALLTLKVEGYVRGHQGRGNFVADAPPAGQSD
jgi:DNA-binding GntR family transcriptional regulator